MTSENAVMPRRRGLLRALAEDPELAARVGALREIGRRVRASEYHLTNACNLRCQGCWFFEYGFDGDTRELTNLESWRGFAQAQAGAGVTAALLIGGEPALYPDRISAFVDVMDFVSISSNGLLKVPYDGFERVSIGLTLFGGVGADDRLRAIRPSGNRFDGLFDKGLANYKNDPRGIWIYALDPDNIGSIRETVARIADNGNILSFNYYSKYGSDDPMRSNDEDRLLEEALRVRDSYPEAVVSHPYYIRALITGRTDWGKFGYDVCPSISVDHPDHKERIKNGNPVLPGFNVFAADGKTLNFCCTSGHCESCRDSQAVQSWLVSSIRRFMRMEGGIRLWVELAESYWSQFVWSPYSGIGAHRPPQ